MNTEFGQKDDDLVDYGTDACDAGHNHVKL